MIHQRDESFLFLARIKRISLTFLQNLDLPEAPLDILPGHISSMALTEGDHEMGAFTGGLDDSILLIGELALQILTE